MYYTGVDPRNMQSVHVTHNPHEKAMQRALIQYRNPANYELVEEALHKAGREDLIGYDAKCLIRPRKQAAQKPATQKKGASAPKTPSKSGAKTAKPAPKKGKR
jgi:hypothetical protein